MLPAPLLYVSAFFEATSNYYYEGLRGITERGDWTAWIEYFLNGVARQSEDALSRAERINSAEKIARFLDLFGTRRSVYPKRWENGKSAKNG